MLDYRKYIYNVRAGCISSKNRRGDPRLFPIMSISLAGVDLSHGVYSGYIEVNDACAELKKRAKAHPGSHYSLDRRVADSEGPVIGNRDM